MEFILKQIELIRKEKGIKQAVIAEQLGVKQNTYSNYMNRSSDIPYSRLSQIADKLKMSVVDVITYPVKYVPESAQCEECQQLKLEIKQLSEYIEILKKNKK